MLSDLKLEKMNRLVRPTNQFQLFRLPQRKFGRILAFKSQDNNSKI